MCEWTKFSNTMSKKLFFTNLYLTLSIFHARTILHVTLLCHNSSFYTYVTFMPWFFVLDLRAMILHVTFRAMIVHVDIFLVINAQNIEHVMASSIFLHLGLWPLIIFRCLITVYIIQTLEFKFTITTSLVISRSTTSRPWMLLTPICLWLWPLFSWYHMCI